MKQALWGLMAGVALVPGHGVAQASAPAFDWLEGHWCSDQGDRRVDEIWLPAVAGATQGLSRTLSAGAMESFEFMRIETGARGTSFLAQPNGAPPTAFALREHGAQRASFANPANDFPDRIAYRRDGDRLHATISGPADGGERMEIAFDYRRCE